jgi:hypothetical protein
MISEISCQALSSNEIFWDDSVKFWKDSEKFVIGRLEDSVEIVKQSINDSAKFLLNSDKSFFLFFLRKLLSECSFDKSFDNLCKEKTLWEEQSRDKSLIVHDRPKMIYIFSELSIYEESYASIYVE